MLILRRWEVTESQLASSSSSPWFVSSLGPRPIVEFGLIIIDSSDVIRLEFIGSCLFMMRSIAHTKIISSSCVSSFEQSTAFISLLFASHLWSLRKYTRFRSSMYPYPPSCLLLFCILGNRCLLVLMYVCLRCLSLFCSLPSILWSLNCLASCRSFHHNRHHYFDRNVLCCNLSVLLFLFCLIGLPVIAQEGFEVLLCVRMSG